MDFGRTRKSAAGSPGPLILGRILKGGVLDPTNVGIGFEFGGERIPLVNPQRGIFKPRQWDARRADVRLYSEAAYQICPFTLHDY
jgi:hypothetical protein